MNYLIKIAVFVLAIKHLLWFYLVDMYVYVENVPFVIIIKMKTIFTKLKENVLCVEITYKD